MAKLSVYNLAELGVNTTASPVHAKDGELTKAQNAVVDPSNEEGGLTKRGGLATVLGSVLGGGAVKGLIAIPQAYEGNKVTTLYAAMQGGATYWSSSTNGTTWTGITTPQIAQQIVKVTGGGLDSIRHSMGRPCVHVAGRFYYAIDTYTQYSGAGHNGPVVAVFDGTNDLQVVRIPFNPDSGTDNRSSLLITEMIAHNGMVYIAAKDAQTAGTLNRGRIFQLNPKTHEVLQVGPAFTTQGSAGSAGATPWCMVSFLGRLWVGFSDNYGGANATGKIYSIRPFIDTDWTLEATEANGWVQSMAVFQGSLYYGSSNTVDTVNNECHVMVRSQLGVYSASKAGTLTPGGQAHYCSLFVYSDALYAVLVETGVTKVEIQKYDGTSWTTDYDIDANEANRTQIGQAIVVGTAAYLVIHGTTSDGGTSSGRILRKTTGGGAWANVKNLNARGFISYTKL